MKYLEKLSSTLLLFLLVACIDNTDPEESVNSDVNDYVPDLIVADTTPPSITLNGDSIITILLGETYVELGATAINDSGEYIDVVIAGEVNPQEVGLYTITYTATDSANNTFTRYRVVWVEFVADKTPPIITLIGDSSITWVLGDNYIDFGAVAIDERDGVVTVQTNVELDVNTLGVYQVAYTASDNSGNTSTSIRTVTIVTPPLKFVTTWKTNNPGGSDSNQIKITTSGEGYNYHVNWGDDSTDENVSGNITHTYVSEGTYTVSISGDFPQIYFEKSWGFDNKKLLSIEQWGNIQWKSMNKAFYYCNVNINATDVPDLSQVTDMSFMFSGNSSFDSGLSGWDVSKVTNMQGVFKGANKFNQDLSSWDVSSVEDMSEMFYEAYEFNQDLTHWDVSSVEDMSEMFYEASEFNQDLTSWDVSNVRTMQGMFKQAINFNQPLNSWIVSSVIDMSEMFYNADTFNQPISSWDVSSVEDMWGMFKLTDDFNQPLDNWDVSSVEDMWGMFYQAKKFDQSLDRWDISSVEDMGSMFDKVTLSTENYDALLLSWSKQSLQFNVRFSAGKSIYSEGSQDAVNTLVDFFNWSITDGGVE